MALDIHDVGRVLWERLPAVLMFLSDHREYLLDLGQSRFACVHQGVATSKGRDLCQHAGAADLHAGFCCVIQAKRRRANLEMLRRLDDAQWGAGGKGDNQPITVRALAYVMAGHVRHHLQILRERLASPSRGRAPISRPGWPLCACSPARV